MNRKMYRQKHTMFSIQGEIYMFQRAFHWTYPTFKEVEVTSVFSGSDKKYLQMFFFFAYNKISETPVLSSAAILTNFKQKRLSCNRRTVSLSRDSSSAQQWVEAEPQMKWKWKDKTTQIREDPVCNWRSGDNTPRRFGFHASDTAHTAPFHHHTLVSDLLCAYALMSRSNLSWF